MVQKEERADQMAVITKARGRPKSYDRTAALRAMRRVFWAQGFAATSLDDLTAATAMNRPSLYNAFGDKTGIFRLVLEDYVNEIRPLFRAAFNTPGHLRDGLMAVYEAAFAVYLSPEAQGLGCFMIGAALTDSARDAEVGGLILASLREIEQGFVWRMRRAQAEGELSPDADIKALARLAASAHNMISVRMRAGDSVADLRAYLKQMIEILCKSG